MKYVLHKQNRGKRKKGENQISKHWQNCVVQVKYKTWSNSDLILNCLWSCVSRPHTPKKTNFSVACPLLQTVYASNESGVRRKDSCRNTLQNRLHFSHPLTSVIYCIPSITSLLKFIA